MAHRDESTRPNVRYSPDRSSPNKPRTACILVLGAHRSGTSALTRVFNIHGCSLPATLMGPNLGNEQGHWESEAISAFNDEVLASAGTSWDDWQPFNDNWYKSPVAERFAERADGLLRHEFADEPLFILKDPRICRLAPLWLDVLAGHDVDTGIVLPVRNPAQVADSLLRRDGTYEWTGKLLWLRYVLDAEYTTRGRKRIFATYDQLLNSWKDIIYRSGEAFEIVFPRQTAVSDREVAQFLQPRETGNTNRSVPRADQTDVGFDAAVWISRTYDVMARWAVGNEEVADHALLDQIRTRFNQVSQALGPAFSTEANRGAPGEAASLRNSLEQAHQQLTRLGAERLAAEEQAHALNAEFEGYKGNFEHEIAQIRAELICQTEALQNKHTQLDRAHAEIHASAAHASHLSQELHDRQTALESADEQNEALRVELTAARQEGAELQRELAAKEAALAQAKVKSEELSLEVASATMEGDRLLGVLTTKEVALVEAEQRYEAQRAELAAARAEGNRLDGELTAKGVELLQEKQRGEVLNGELLAARAESERLGSELAAKEAALVQAVKANLALQSDLERLGVKSARLDDELATREAALMKVVQQAQELADRFEAYKAESRTLWKRLWRALRHDTAT